MRLLAGHKEILRIALPAIVSNITVPLLSLIDVAIVGHLGDAAYIGAIAVGGMLFNIIYWIFGFLRMGTGGLTSQAYGRNDWREVTLLLIRAIGVGLIIASCLIFLHYPITQLAFHIIDTTLEVALWATRYFRICIWGAPAVLGLYALSGWFIGMQNSRFPMWVAITQNVVNILVSLTLVFGFGMKVEGVAIGTLVAQYAGFMMAVWLCIRYYGTLRIYIDIKAALMRRREMWRFFQVNRDIFFRTLCLVTVTMFFTSSGAAQGDIVLAVNTLLMQLFTLYTYIMDGIAYAGEALAGKYIGASDQKALRRVVRQSFLWSIMLSAFFITLYAVAGEPFLSLLTDDAEVLSLAGDYFYWTLAIPIAGFAAFTWDGIYIGATATRGMLTAMFSATILFFVLYFSTHVALGNHALWLAFISYLVCRGVVLSLLSPKLLRINR